MAGFPGDPTGIARDLAGTALDLLVAATTVAKTIKDNTPRIEDEVTVEVVGQPNCSKQRLYFLALATANGMVRQFVAGLNPLVAFVSPSFGILMIEYDASAEWVRCTIKYETGTIAAIAGVNPLTGGTPTFGTTGSLFNQLAVYRGPQSNVNGGNFNFVASPGPVSSALTTVLGGAPGAAAGLIGLGVVPGVPANATSAQAPQLPFAGQRILTSGALAPTPRPAPLTQLPVPDAPLVGAGPTIAAPNPLPPGDNRSRGMVVTPGIAGVALVPLVFAALSAPATNSHMLFPAPVTGGPPGPTLTPG